ncbi:P-loop containing nucleoside triphosphate hydrolase protein [Mycena maculata]|uniref:P-loop containing nucleoside triphosphate hydrolase protein n=1 Tax=Mycena maculata TaxID=230809 RepID=A0AAD7JC47_9AGAR|nr:P-loop containing nucleoside triphosphate hydrolase protein [Mycena maculata]
MASPRFLSSLQARVRSIPSHGLRTCVSSSARTLKHFAKDPLVLNIPRADVYRFGDANRATPVFRDLEWSIKANESWAIVGTGSGEKQTLFDMLMGHLRIQPPPPPPAGLFPFLSNNEDPHKTVSIVSFANKRTAGGAFYDYTARYGAVREEDRITLRQSMFPETIDDLKAQSRIALESRSTDPKLFEHLVNKMGLAHLLDLPRIVLSNGQTRRARILKALLEKPRLLLLDEPLTGLDVANRSTVLEILHELHSACDPHIIIALRMQDAVPSWITHLAVVNEGTVRTGPKDSLVSYQAQINEASAARDEQAERAKPNEGEAVVEMKDVCVTYGPRRVLKNVNWTIRAGQRYHLQGPNGSGKTTLLALLTGDHPQSYAQSPGHLRLFGLPRSKLATRVLAARIGVVSPELFDAFPRRAPGMSVWEAVGTGFDGGFVALGARGVGIGLGGTGALSEAEEAARVERCWDVLRALGPDAWGTGEAEGEETERWAQRKFMDLPVGEQRMVLLMRALVGRAQLILLDEVWSGMDHRMIGAARHYLRSGGVGPEQSVVVVTHLDDEVPWGERDGVVRVRLDGGEMHILAAEV